MIVPKWPVGGQWGSVAMRWWVLSVLFVAGCDNPCQRLCQNMADLAADCGISVSGAEIDACVNAQASITVEERRTCRDDGSAEILRAQWTCEDVALYFR